MRGRLCFNIDSISLRLKKSETVSKDVGFEVLTAVVMKITIFLDTMPCSPLRGNRRFGGKYRLHLQGRKGYMFLRNVG
jgi:hypothetical protein